MVQHLKNVVKKLNDVAIEKGANSTKLISTKDIIVENWVRQKCQYGCDGYANYFNCPPYTPTPSDTKKVLQNYKKGLLIELTGLRKKEDHKKMQEIIYELEREAFLNGLYKAFSYAAGRCRICVSCPAAKVNPTEYGKKGCSDPIKARPSMEACGINVYQTVRKVGYKIDVVKEKSEFFKSFGLLLLE